MTDWSRLTEYIEDYFPESSYSTAEIRSWAQENVPAWKYMPEKDKNEILSDWENFIAGKVEEQITEVREGIGEKRPSFWKRLRGFLGRLFK